MAAPRLKNDEDAQTRSLREIASFGHNKFCFDCSQRGPTYVNMTIGSFVCTSCSGHLRGLNPPHRVKSISMASFSMEEIDFIRCRGNEFCSKVWGPPGDDPVSQVLAGDSGRVTSLMSQKYEQKRWYTKPTDEMYAEARRANLVSTGLQTGIVTTTVTGLSKPIYQMSGSQSVPNIQGLVLSVQRPSPSVNRTAPMLANAVPLKHQVSVTSPSMPITSQSWQDPFAPQPHLVDAGFANFANFSSAQSDSPSRHQQPPFLNSTASQGGSALVSNEFQRISALPSVASSNDKYAALANVNSADGTINWHGSAFAHEPESTQRPSGDQFVTNMCQHFTAERNSSNQMTSLVRHTPQTSSVVNPFSSMSVAATSFFNPSQYVLLQTGARTCYMPAAVYVTGQFGGTNVAPAAVYASPTPAVPFSNQPPLHYASNPFLNIAQSTSSVRRDVTNPFL